MGYVLKLFSFGPSEGEKFVDYSKWKTRGTLLTSTIIWFGILFGMCVLDLSNKRIKVYSCLMWDITNIGSENMAKEIKKKKE